jgi:hypothetical protein
MPGFYPQGRYDLAGFCLGVVEEDRLIDDIFILCCFLYFVRLGCNMEFRFYQIH